MFVCPLSFFGCLECSSATFFSLSFFFFSLSLSLSLRRWGNPNPVWGLGFPLCSLLPGRGLRLQPVLRAQHLHLGFAPAPAFFFSRRRRSLVGWWSVSFCSVSLGLAVCCSLSLHAHVMLLQEIRGSQTIIWRPHYYHECVWGMSWSRQPYCHTVFALECLFPQGGNAVRFFHFVFFVSG